MKNARSTSLAPHTGEVFEAISKLECIKPFTLVGGTALSLQIGKRQSEDLVASMNRIHYLNNMYLADMESIGAMKM